MGICLTHSFSASFLWMIVVSFHWEINSKSQFWVRNDVIAHRNSALDVESLLFNMFWIFRLLYCSLQMADTHKQKQYLLRDCNSRIRLSLHSCDSYSCWMNKKYDSLIDLSVKNRLLSVIVMNKLYCNYLSYSINAHCRSRNQRFYYVPYVKNESRFRLSCNTTYIITFAERHLGWAGSFNAQ